MESLKRLARSEGGASVIFVAISLVMIFAFAVLAIDIGTLFVTRTQLENAADAGALAGAMGMIQSLEDTATAVQWAITLAGENEAFIDGGEGVGNTRSSVVITPEDVTFPAPYQVRVTTHRTTATGDPLRTMFLGVINPASDGYASVRGSATAWYYYVCGSDCFRPWAPPDRWHDENGDGFYNPDSGDYYDPDGTGYRVPDHVGVQITFMLANGNLDGFGEDWYYAVNFPPVNKGNPISGADQYREWIEGCVDPSITVELGDTLRCEPGKMVGPTNQGVEYLIGLDPGAHWDAATQQVVGSDPIYTVSPRIIKACLFDPDIGRVDVGGGRGVVVVKMIAFFLEGRVGGGGIVGRFLQMADPGGEACDDPSDPSFLYAVKLVQ
ncbi:MAG: pilus assembly protein TadG-related protein [Candidatus Eisenbacteria bacterium]